MTLNNIVYVKKKNLLKQLRLTFLGTCNCINKWVQSNRHRTTINIKWLGPSQSEWVIFIYVGLHRVV